MDNEARMKFVRQVFDVNYDGFRGAIRVVDMEIIRKIVDRWEEDILDTRELETRSPTFFPSKENIEWR